MLQHHLFITIRITKHSGGTPPAPNSLVDPASRVPQLQGTTNPNQYLHILVLHNTAGVHSSPFLNKNIHFEAVNFGRSSPPSESDGISWERSVRQGPALPSSHCYTK
eukprot:gene2592-1611_t